MDAATCRHVFVGAFVLSLMLSVLNNDCAVAQEVDEAAARVVNGFDLGPATVAVRREARLLLQLQPQGANGLVVVGIEPGSPALDMKRVDMPGVRGIVELGDVITHLNGTRVTKISEYFQVMRAAGADVRVSIRDVNGQGSIDWLVRPVLVDVIGAPDPPLTQVVNARLHVIIAALTEDASIGRFIEKSVPLVKDLFQQFVSQDRLGALKLLAGQECSARSILAAVDELSVSPQDTICAIYLGHGAFDPAHSQGDPAGGHFLALPAEDLLRKTLFRHLAAKQARFTVLMSDCCNVHGAAEVPQNYVWERRTMTCQGWSFLEELMFCHRGVLDFTASSRGEFSWFSSDVGGWFTSILCEELQNSKEIVSRDWDPVWQHLVTRTDTYYRNRRDKLLGMPGGLRPDTRQQLQGQEHMVPMAFQFSVVREEPSDAPTTTRTIQVPVSKLQ